MTQSPSLRQAGSAEGARRLGALLLAPFAAVGRFLVALGEASPRMRALETLHRTSDAELTARGLTRDGEIRRIIGVGGTI